MLTDYHDQMVMRMPHLTHEPVVHMMAFIKHLSLKGSLLRKS